ncbi:MAG: hypothetical protein V2I35_06700 [Desulfocapsaceae bacterium]|jgi:hypothetical protein|nr:hypothetical protein [Desulfocapsaceae bacterium]
MKHFLQVFVLLLCFSGSAYAGYLEILYVNANIGAAAGGHVGLKLDDDVFHYQFYPDERFLLVRESWEPFKLVYNRLRNRTIYAAGWSVPDDVSARIRSHFTAALASQNNDFSRYRFLLEQKQMLAGLDSGLLEVSVRGLGFFEVAEKTSAPAKILRSRIVAALGQDYLSEKREAIAAGLQNVLATLHEGRHEAGKLIEIVRRISDLRKKQAAYDSLDGGAGLLSSARVVGMDEKLSQQVLDNLSHALNRRFQVLVRLLNSERSDAGEAILVEAARCLALIESLRSKTLITLDPYSEDAVEKPFDPENPEMQHYLHTLSGLLKRRCLLLLDSGANGTGAARDYHYLQLENVNGRLAEIGRAVSEGQGIRLSPEMMMPGRKRTLRTGVPPLEKNALDSALFSIDQDLSALEQNLAEKYRYALIARNCVTELLKNLNSSFSNKEAAEKFLGGWIDPIKDRVAVPHDFFYKASASYRIEQVTRYPSRRLMQVEAMQAKSSAAAVWLREGNTVSTTLYKRRIEDSPFLFFTDDVGWPRPILGLANLLWSAGHGLAGIVRLPVEGMDPVRQAARGMFYSLPEFVFFNIRKGTYLYDTVYEGGHEL